jgi:hypothetical protein
VLASVLYSFFRISVSIAETRDCGCTEPLGISNFCVSWSLGSLPPGTWELEPGEKNNQKSRSKSDCTVQYCTATRLSPFRSRSRYRTGLCLPLSALEVETRFGVVHIQYCDFAVRWCRTVQHGSSIIPDHRIYYSQHHRSLLYAPCLRMT